MTIHEQLIQIEKLLDAADEQACTSDFTDSIRNVIKAQMELIEVVRKMRTEQIISEDQ
jgi:hypothetical protein